MSQINPSLYETLLQNFDGELDLYVRPEDLRVGEGGWEATVVGSQRSGPRVRLRAQLHGVDEQVELELPVRTDATGFAARVPDFGMPMER